MEKTALPHLKKSIGDGISKMLTCHSAPSMVLKVMPPLTHSYPHTHIQIQEHVVSDWTVTGTVYFLSYSY